MFDLGSGMQMSSGRLGRRGTESIPRKLGEAAMQAYKADGGS